MMLRLLVDTNILVLWVVGTFDEDLIRRYRRTAHFTPDDFRLLRAERLRYGDALTTGPILTEMSNLFGNDFHVDVAATLVQVCDELVEITRPKEDVFRVEGFDRLGYADASALAALDERTTLLTDDVALYAQALTIDRDAINFNHLRRFG